MLKRCCDRCGEEIRDKYAAVRIQTDVDVNDKPAFVVCLGFDLCSHCITAILVCVAPTDPLTS